MVFQNPYSSLDPKMKIIDTLKEPLQINTDLSDEDIEAIIKEKLKSRFKRRKFRIISA